MTIVYGIKTCDTVRKATAWLKKHHVDFRFHDFREDGIDKKKLGNWCDIAGWETLVNKKSTTWRGLTEAQQAGITNKKAAITILQEHPTLIKRPVIEHNQSLLVGYDEKKLETTFK